ncbi:TAXI family TRAP transporter solute-binding subunit [Rhodococcoides kyotonense]|uniref:C4-dicarboxylate ABC transporter substrate-binding protein n=1 Tax=Rhodococcoides kyotonense TaxID=398843 RepID=A0A239EC37_9NOCA|nr:TAXI family TRAP transporter solute-binding subunit [Rhodococcus kyotonensis]SNS42167.1 hypothetical protein SAMN05421642_102305 [Rhodococcus kyotonensis]
MNRRSLLLGALGVAAGGVACSRPAIPDVGSLRLATGPAGATYRETGTALADRWNAVLGREVVSIVETDAAVDNARMLDDRAVELGFVNSDVAAPYRDRFVALFRVFDSVLHLAVKIGGPVRTLQDLPGRRVAMGLTNSGTRFTAQRLLGAVGIDVAPLSYGQNEAADALLRDEVDAVFSLTAMPTPAIDGLVAASSSSGRGIEFVDLTTETDQVQTAFPGEYLPVVISGTVYPGVPSSRTFAVPTLVLVRNDFPFDLAKFLTHHTFDSAEALSANRPEADQINPRTGAATTPMTLHPGSAAWFREHKP